MLWEFKTNDRVYSSALIVEEVVYFGSGDQNFYAVTKKNGKKIWEFKTQGRVHSSAATFQNMVYFSSADGNLYALDKNSGRLFWKFASKGEKSYGLWDYYLSSPIVSDGVIYWGSGDVYLYAVDGTNVNLKWKYKMDDIVHAFPTIDENKVYFGSFDGYFYALNKDNGAVIWRFKTIGDTSFPKGEIQKSALVHDGMVYFGSCDYNIYALDMVTGIKNCNMKDSGGWIIATPTVYKENIYLGTSDGHVFYAMDKKSGKKIIRKAPLAMRLYGAAVAHKGIIYFGTFDGKLLGMDYKTGALKWSFQTEKSKQNYHTIYNKNGHFREGFELYGTDYVETEEKIHELGSILSTPVIDDGVIYFGSSDGNYYAAKL
ncbi:MAG: outer membrane protein assembly factor BamB [Saprospiraceae bacterium]